MGWAVEGLIVATVGQEMSVVHLVDMSRSHTCVSPMIGSALHFCAT